MAKKQPGGVDYSDRDVRDEILLRQRRDMWTPEQIGSLAGHFGLQRGAALLDVGCGYGYCLRTYGPYCMPRGRLVGFDRESDHLAAAARLAKREGLGAATTFDLGDVYALPYEPGTFDVVMAQVLMCHLAEPERALEEMIRVAKPRGCIAVFDNAVSGCYSGYSNTYQPTIRQRLVHEEHALLAHEGRKKLGLGDWSVGLHMPVWMEAHGLVDVDVRANERVHWIAPPYRSRAQRTELQGARERCREDGFFEMNVRNTISELRAAGADETTVRSAVRSMRRRDRRYRDAMADETAAYAFGGSFWCIWGFKR